MLEPVRFPDVELYRGWGQPMRTECEIRGLELTQGAIPQGLEGALYKVGADRQYPSGRTDDIFIDGEGMIHMFLVYYTPTLAIAQNMVAANMRASSAFVAAIVLGLVGTGLGPSLTGILSDFFAQHAFGSGDFKAACVGVAGRHALSAPAAQLCQSASATGIRYAIMAMSLLCPWGAIHYFMAARHFRADLETRYSAVE